MAPSTSKRQKERRENRIAKKALLKEQKKKKNCGSSPTATTTKSKEDDEKIVHQITVDNLLTAAEHTANMDGGNPMKAIELYNAAEIMAVIVMAAIQLLNVVFINISMY
jgi:hypothetical protein